MSRILRCLMPLAALLLAGCFPTLYTDAPLGEPARFEPSEWDGIWVCAGSSDESGRGIGRVRIGVAGIEGVAVTENWRECNAEAAHWESLMKARRYGDWYFDDSCEGRLATGEPCAIWIVARRFKESVLLTVPDEARIRQLVTQGKLPGRIELMPENGKVRERVVVGPLADDHYKVLFGPAMEAFELLPLSCIRLPAELDPCNKPQ